jgi:CBS domain-containing protein
VPSIACTVVVSGAALVGVFTEGLLIDAAGSGSLEGVIDTCVVGVRSEKVEVSEPIACDIDTSCARPAGAVAVVSIVAAT